MYSIGLDLGISSVGWSVIDERTGNVINTPEIEYISYIRA